MAGDRAGRSGGGTVPTRCTHYAIIRPGTAWPKEPMRLYCALELGHTGEHLYPSNAWGDAVPDRPTVGPSGDPAREGAARVEAIRERVEKARSTGHLRDMVNWRESAADVPYLLERLAELERALRDIVDEAGPCDLTYPKSKHSHDIIDRPPCCIERGRAALRAGG